MTITDENKIMADSFFEKGKNCLFSESSNSIEKYETAYMYFDRAINYFPYVAKYYYFRGLMSRELQRWGSAVAKTNAFDNFSEAIRINSDFIDAYIALAREYEIYGEHWSAINVYDEVINKDPKNYLPHYWKGIILKNQLGDMDNAIIEFTKSIQCNPSDVLSYVDRGLSYDEIGNLDCAIKDFSEAIRLDPDMETYYDRAWVYKKKGDLKAAILDYGQCIRIHPNDGYNFRYRGNAYFENGDILEAIRDYSTAIQLDPDDAESYNSRGDAYYSINDLHNAYLDYKKAVSLDPSNKQFREDRDNIARMQNEAPISPIHPLAEKDQDIKKREEIVTKVDQEEKCSDDIEALTNELNMLIGLETVKSEVYELLSYIKTQSLRKKMGLPTTNLSLHVVFYGNPGTGKTTVARIYGRILHAMGLLEKGHIIETDRSGLVAKYVGQTAVKTNEKIDEAIGGVLFIDEAYSLFKGEENEWDYGSEAIEVIMKRMEDDREHIAVIVAGYTGPMQDFLNSNEGFKSRFSNEIHFEDFTPDELKQIFLLFCKKNQYILGFGSTELLELIINKEYKQRDQNFGNARYCRNIFEKLLKIQSIRVSTQISNPSIEQICTFEPEDFQRFIDKT